MAVLAGALGLMVEDTYQLYPALSLSFGAGLAGITAGMRIQARK